MVKSKEWVGKTFGFANGGGATRGAGLRTRFDPVVLDDVEVEKLRAVRRAAEALAQAIERIPSGRERSLALTKVEESVLWAGRATAVARRDWEG